MTGFWIAVRFAEVFRAREGTGGGTLTAGRAGVVVIGVPVIVSLRVVSNPTIAYMARTIMPSPQAEQWQTSLAGSLQFEHVL